MPIKPNTLDTLRFALELLKRIPRNTKISAPELHRQLQDAGWQRDLRTVQRQLEELSQTFDIERDDRSKPYGYQWKQQAKGLALPGLTEHESLLLALAHAHLRNLLPARVMRSMEPFFEQARAQLAPRPDQPLAARQAKAWLNKVRVVSTSMPLIAPELKAGVLEAVSEALYQDRWLEVSYRNSASKTTQSRVMPLGLAQQGPRLYLVCRFDGYDNERSLAMHRILSATPTGLPFERPKSFDLEKYDDDGRFGFGEGKRIKLRIRIQRGAGLHLLESPVSRDQTHKDLGDWLEISATVVASERLKWWLRGFGPAVEVLSPTKILR